MSLNLLTFTENNTLSSISSFRIISYSDTFKNVLSIQDIFDVVLEETSSYYAQRSFRYSKDGISWSLWIDFSPSETSPNIPNIRSLTFDPSIEYYFEVKYLVKTYPNISPELPDGSPIDPFIVIKSLDIIINYQSIDPYAGFDIRPVNSLCSDEFSTIPVLFQNKNYTFNPYAVNRGIALYQDLSNMVNNLFGHDVSYWRSVPQSRSRDVVFKEYTIYHVEPEKCLKVLVPNNEFPDSKVNFGPFGIDFEQPFEIHVDRKYWESFFGKNTMPQKRDVIYFHINNRIFEIQSSYVYRDFMQQPLYFKVSLIKYQPKSDTYIPTEDQLILDEITLSTEDLFGDEMKSEIEKITKPQQYVTITHDSDPTREKVLRTLPITKWDFYNNWTLIFDHYYDLNSVFKDYKGLFVETVGYRKQVQMLENSNCSFTCWFNPMVNSVNGDKQRPLLKGIDTISVKGIDIILIFQNNGTSQINLTINSNTYEFILQQTINKDSWYAIVVNWSNEFLQASVDLYTQTQNTSHLLNISHEAKIIASDVYDTDFKYKILASPINISSIRLFNEMISEEKQNLVLNQMIVKDSDKAILIDSCRPLLRLPRITKPK